MPGGWFSAKSCSTRCGGPGTRSKPILSMCSSACCGARSIMADLRVDPNGSGLRLSNGSAGDFMSLPIQTRLTLWYGVTLLVILLVFAGAVEFAAKPAINGSVDYDLQMRLESLKIFMKDQIPRFPRTRLAHQFSEHSALSPGGERMQIADQAGNWVFQSETMPSLHLPAADEHTPEG